MNIAKRWNFFGIVILFCVALFSCERTNQKVQAARENTDSRAINDTDRQFIVDAEQDNIKERNLGRVVMEKSQNNKVRDYGQMLVDDHTAALRDLVDLMQKKDMRQPGSLPEAKHEALGKLDDLSGPEFDRQFIALMVEDHQKAVATFRTEQTSAADADVRKYATETLPVLEKHLNKAEELQRELSNTGQ